MRPDQDLDTLLAGCDEHLDDDGFTARVMADLPPRRAAARPLILVLAATVAALVAFVLSPGGQWLVDALAALAGYRLAGAPPLLPLALVALVVAGAVGLVTSET